MLAACDSILGIRGLDVDATQPGGSGRDSSKDEDDGGGDDPGIVTPGPDAPLASDGGPGKRVFVTSGTVQGDFGGVEKAHEKCKEAATKANLGGEWVAWVSSEGKKAKDALTSEGPYVLLDGTLVASTKETLTSGAVAALINVTESGAKVGGTGDLTGVWTGTRSDGEVGETCSNWTTTNPFISGTVGDPKKKDKNWTDTPAVGGWDCILSGRLYCFEL